jgi:murein DD-endopeptidase MepM/ murein hydrolase activator NlpD
MTRELRAENPDGSAVDQPDKPIEVKEHLETLRDVEERRAFLKSETGRWKLQQEFEEDEGILGAFESIANVWNAFDEAGWEGGKFALFALLDDWNLDFFGWHDEVDEDPDENTGDAASSSRGRSSRSSGGSGRSGESRTERTGSRVTYDTTGNPVAGVPSENETDPSAWAGHGPCDAAYVTERLKEDPPKQPYVGRGPYTYTNSKGKTRTIHYPTVDAGLPEGFGPISDTSTLASPNAPYFTFQSDHPGTYTSKPGHRTNPHARDEGQDHKGYDIKVPRVSPDEPVPIVITRACQIQSVNFKTGTGARVVLRWLDGVGNPVAPDIYFMHLHEVPMHYTRGQKIMPPYAIGRIGHTGSSTGPHLHYQVGTGSNVVTDHDHMDPRIS